MRLAILIKIKEEILSKGFKCLVIVIGFLCVAAAECAYGGPLDFSDSSFVAGLKLNTCDNGNEPLCETPWTENEYAEWDSNECAYHPSRPFKWANINQQLSFSDNPASQVRVGLSIKMPDPSGQVLVRFGYVNRGHTALVQSGQRGPT